MSAIHHRHSEEPGTSCVWQGPCYEMMARATADVLFEWDLNCRRLWWGGGLNGRFGFPRDSVELDLAAWSKHVHPQDRERVVDGVRCLLDESGEAWSDEFRVVCKDGSTAFVLARGFVLRDPLGRPLKLIGGMHDITSRRECEENLDQSRRQLRALSSRLQQLREEDRTRIARDLHDKLGQMLTGLKLDLGWIEKNMTQGSAGNPALLEKLMETEEIVDSAIGEVQRIATDFRPDLLDNLGLASAIKCELEVLHQRTGMDCRVEVIDGVPDSSPGIAIGLFRILQEALTNVVRHARATTVIVKLWHQDPQLRMEITDDGVGIDPAELIRPGALGLLGMRERATMLGGSIEISRQPRGTKVCVSVPLQEPTSPLWDLPR